MIEFADVKPGDLLLYENESGLLLQSVVIGFFDSSSVRIRAAGSDGDTFHAPMFVYTIKPDEPKRVFCWVTRKRWKNGIEEDHVPREKAPELSTALLESARSMIKQSYAGASDYFKPNDEDKVYFSDIVQLIDEIIVRSAQ